MAVDKSKVENAIKLEEMAYQGVEPKKEEQSSAAARKPEPASKIVDRTFTLNGGKTLKGIEIINMVKGNPNGLKLWQAFFDKFGGEVADTAAVSLYYENGTLKTDSVGVCSAKFMVNGDYRNCVYADLNSAGMDSGLKQINSYYQRKRIAKLGGPDCYPSNSRDITDPCTKSQVEWLLSVDNNINIAIDIYKEQGFCPWYGYQRAFQTCR